MGAVPTLSPGRRDLLCRAIAAHGADEMVVTRPANVRYLTGYRGSNGVCLVGSQGGTLLTDGRYLTQAATEAPSWNIVEGPPGLLSALPTVMPSPTTRIGFEEDHLTMRQLDGLRRLFPSPATLVPLPDLVAEYRSEKQPDELAALRQAVALADEALGGVLAAGVLNASRLDLELGIAREIALRGGKPAFPPNVMIDSSLGRSYAQPCDAIVTDESIVTVVFGAEVGGYKSRCARTLALDGAAAGEPARALDTAICAADAAADSLMPGAPLSQAFVAAAAVLGDRGYPEPRGQVGRGVGLEISELPHLTSTVPGVVCVDNVLAIEIAIGLQDGRDVLVGDTVHVTRAGGERYTTMPMSELAPRL